MVNVQVKNVPEATHAVLRRRAAAAHQSLQEYLLQQLVEGASHPTHDELFDRIRRGEGGRTGGGGTLEDTLRARDEGRAGR